MRNKSQKYPKFNAEIEEIKKNGITTDLIQKIIDKHRANAEYNRELYERYQCLEEGVPIFSRKPRFGDSDSVINNKINNDFFSEICDFKIGYFAGVPISYSYSMTEESKEDTDADATSVIEQEQAVKAASKALTDFTTLNGMADKDMEMTKYAAVCGYAGRLLYHDPDGNERVMITKPFESIILSETENIAEPTFSIRYYEHEKLDGSTVQRVEYYDSEWIRFFEGYGMSMVEYQPPIPNLFGYCPLQGIPNNEELLGDAEKVIAAIDAYDKAISDGMNDTEAFANAYLVYENVNISDEEIAKGQATGSIQFYTGGANGKVYFLTKDVNDTFVSNNLQRLEKNIYRFSKTPNLNDETFNSASGISLKFKLTSLEAKCGMFEAKVTAAGVYMFKLLANAWSKKQIAIDPLQVVMEYKRNFPLDMLSEAQTAQALIAAGLPKRIAYQLAISGIDDVDYVMQLIEEEKDSIPSLFANIPEDEEPTEEEKPVVQPPQDDETTEE